MASMEQVMRFINTIGPKAVAICNKKSRKILPSVCIAQACCESAYGTSQRMIHANALFGFKVGSGVKYGTAWKGKYYNTMTREVYSGKNYNIRDKFRAYDTVDESIEDYYDLIGKSSRYANAIGKTNPRVVITAIKNGGYATDPNYIPIILSIIDKYGLTKFDACMNNTKSKKEDQPAISVTDNDCDHVLGERVSVKYYYDASTSATGRKNKLVSGVIRRVIPSAKNPYLISNSAKTINIGWTNDDGIVSNTKKKPVSKDTKDNTKFDVKDKVTMSRYFKDSTDTDNPVIRTVNGVITKIVEGAKNPYLVSTNNIPIGWTNDSYLTKQATSSSSKVYYQVESGDTLSKIAKEYKTTVGNILKLNSIRYPKLKANYVLVGWKLRVK